MIKKARFISILLYCFLFFACQKGPEVPDQPAASLNGELSIVEYVIDQLPVAESAELQAVMDATRLDLRFMHEVDQTNIIKLPFCGIENLPGMCITLAGEQLFAYEAYDNQRNSGQVHVTRNGVEIYSIPVGDISPISTLRGLWQNDGHWVLETVLVRNHEENNDISSETIGQISLDGELINSLYGYGESYEYQILGGKPFYMFKRQGRIDASYDGVEVPLGYDEIIHYGCCSASTMNPVHYKNHLDFFARREGEWQYVEIGLIDQ